MTDGLRMRTVETHSAVLVFLGDRVYKFKKAVDLGFLDHRDRAAREIACHEEVALNRRLAPDVYLGVADVTGPDGAPCEHIVVMRRMPEERSLTRCVAAGADVTADLDRIARAVAGLHASSPVSACIAAEHDAPGLRALWRQSFRQLREAGVDTADGRRVEELAERYLAGREPLFAHRIAEGAVRDGHGDLMADDIYLLPDGPRILDCLEFAPDLRIGDVVGDVAFLAMDLERLGRPDLGERFLATYRELSGETWPTSLAHHHVAYRAHVRAKVAALAGAQRLGGGHATSADLMPIARDHLERARVRLVVVGGLPGTGKSTVADAVADELDAVVVRSDEVRRRVAAGQGADRYAPGSVAAVYREALADTEALLGRGYSVVLDATWSAAEDRQQARQVARRTASELVEVRCTAPAGTAEARITARGDAHASEATPAVARQMAGRFAPWPEAVVLDTARPWDRTAADLGEVVAGRRPLSRG